MDKAVLDSMRKIIDCHYEDEKRHFDECEPNARAEHIFLDFKRVRGYLQTHDGSTEDINEIKIYDTYFCVEDVVSVMSNEENVKWGALSNMRKRALIKEHEHSISKGIESGLLYDWDYVMKTAIEPLIESLEKEGEDE